jgi:hypothetical protein
MEEKRKRRPWLWWIPALLMFYLLSIGPLDGLYNRGLIPDGPLLTFLRTVYYPLIYLTSHPHPPVTGWLEWYLHLWS